jgi:hypothetical protein
MTGHAYPTSAMLGDYVRAAAGLLLSGGILATMPAGMFGEAVLAGFAALFAAFGARTALRHGTNLEVTEAGLRASGLLRISIPWSELDRMKLAYYSTRRDRREGWMQLELRSGCSTLRVDSRIEGFTELVGASVRAASRRGLLLDPATSANLQALGVECRAAAPGLREAAGGAA